MAAPRRGRALIAKAVVVAALAAIIGLVGAFGAWAAGIVLKMPMSTSPCRGSTTGGTSPCRLVYLPFAAVIAVSVGTLVRHTRRRRFPGSRLDSDGRAVGATAARCG